MALPADELIMSDTLSLVTYNIHKGFSQFNRRLTVHDLRDRLRHLNPDLVFLQEVQGLHQQHALSYWDALIVASAHIAGCAVLLTEDMGTGEVLAGVKLVNPFAAA